MIGGMDEQHSTDKPWRYFPEWWRWIIAVFLAWGFTAWIFPMLESKTAVVVVSGLFYFVLFLVVLRMRFPPKN